MLDISVGPEFAHVAPQAACGPACFPRELPTFAPIVSPHDGAERASCASVTLSSQLALRSASALRAPKVVSFADSEGVAKSLVSSLASSLASSRGSSGTRQRRAALRHALQTVQRSLPATPQQGSLLSENKKQVRRCAGATPQQRMLLPAPPQQGSLLFATPPQRSLLSVRCAGATPQQASRALVPLKAAKLPVDSSAVLAKCQGKLLPAKR
jgi:hypothetical protein